MRDAARDWICLVDMMPSRHYECNSMNRGAQALASRLAERGEQLRLSASLRIDQGYLSKVASGRRVPGLDVRKKLAAACSIPLEWWDDAVATEEAPEESSPHAAPGKDHVA